MSSNGKHKEFFRKAGERMAVDLQELQQELAPDPHFDIMGQPPGGGRVPVPHIYMFSGIHSNAAKVYLPSDEALRNSRDNAVYMRNDPVVMECVDARQRASALLDWEVLPEDDRSTEQKELCEELTKILQKIRRFNEYRRNLLHAVWYGKYAIQHEYRWAKVSGKSRVMPWPYRTDLGWLPVDGDKLVFRFDDGTNDHLPGQVGIRVSSAKFRDGDDVLLPRGSGRKPGKSKVERIEGTSQGLAYFLPQYERNLLAIHKHEIEDAPWERGYTAGSVHGVGVRSRIYWAWMQKQELLGFLIEYLERSAGGIEIWSYPQGNPQAKEAVQTAAKERVSHGRNIIFFPKPLGEDAMAYDVNIVEPGMAGIEAVKQVLTEYFGHQIKRYILGQTLSSEADATGLGSGLAELHMDSFFQIITYDARNLEETITYELLDKIKRWNFKHARHFDVRFSIKLDDPSVEERLNGLKTAWEMGCKLSSQEVMELVGASVPGPDDEVLENPQIKQAGMMGAMGGGMFGGPGPQGIPQDGDGDGVAGEGQQSLQQHINDTLMGDMFGEPGDDAAQGYSAEGGEWVQRELPYDTGERQKVGEYAAGEPQHRFSCTQVNLPENWADGFRRLAQRIPDAELAEDGRETEPHITVKYGTHTNNPDDVRELLTGEGPVKIRLGKVSIFPAKEASSQRGGEQFDVVKIDVESEDLHRLNRKISDNLEHTDTHPKYQPHLTLAYVKPGEGKKYVGKDWAEGMEFEFSEAVFSDQDHQHTVIPLTGGKDKYSRGGRRRKSAEKDKTRKELEKVPFSKGKWEESQHPRDDDGQFTDTPEVARQKDILDRLKASPERYIDRWLKDTEPEDFFDRNDDLIPAHIQDAMDEADDTPYGSDAADEWLQDVYFQSAWGLQDARKYYAETLRSISDRKLTEQVEEEFGSLQELADLDNWDWYPDDPAGQLNAIREHADDLAAERFTPDGDFGLYLEENPKAWRQTAREQHKAIKSRKPTSSDDVKTEWVTSDEAREVMRQHIQGEIDGLTHEHLSSGDNLWDWVYEGGWDELDKLAKPKKDRHSKKWEEDKHPRDHGKFASTEGSGSTSETPKKRRSIGGTVYDYKGYSFIKKGKGHVIRDADYNEIGTAQDYQDAVKQIDELATGGKPVKSESKPEPKPKTSASDTPAESDIIKHVGDWAKKTPMFPHMRIPDLHEKVGGSIEGLKKKLQEMVRAGQVRLHPYTGAPVDLERDHPNSREYVIHAAQEPKYYVELLNPPKEQYSRRQSRIATVNRLAKSFSPEGRLLFSRALSESRESGDLREELQLSEQIAGTVRGRREIERVYHTLYGAN